MNATNFGNNTWKICFNNYFIKLESVEITTSNLECHPYKFAFDYSPLGAQYIGYQEYSYSMEKNEIKLFDYRTEKLKCFRHTAIKSTCELNYQDITQFEFFGTIYPDNRNCKCNTCFVNNLSMYYYKYANLFIVIFIIDEK